VYEEALAHEFDLRGIPYQRQARLAVRYKEIIAGEFRADFPSTSSGQALLMARL
jgi:GxxExxY protein